MTALPAHLLKPNALGVERLALTTSELAKALGISVRHLQSQIKAGAICLPSIRLGRSRLFPIEAVKTWLAEQSTQDVTKV